MRLESDTVRRLLLFGAICGSVLGGVATAQALEPRPATTALAGHDHPGDAQVGNATNATNETVSVFREDWPENCNDAPTYNASGRYGGVVLSPQDVDSFRFELGGKGTYVTIAPLLPAAEGGAEVRVWGDSDAISTLNVTVEEGEFGSRSSASPIDHAVESNGEGMNASSWQIWSDVDNPTVCIQVFDTSPGAADLPYEWQVRIAGADPTPVTVESTQLAAANRSEVRTLRERVDSLRERVETLESRVDSLEARPANATATSERPANATATSG